MSTTSRPLPAIAADNAGYWRSAKEHALRLQRCGSCGRSRFYPAPVCHACGSQHWEWQPIAGTGSVHSYTVVHRAAVGVFAERMPYTIVLVTLDEGPTMMSNLLDTDGSDLDADDRDELRIGTRVRVAYEDLTDEVTLPVFVPCEQE